MDVSHIWFQEHRDSKYPCPFDVGGAGQQAEDRDALWKDYACSLIISQSALLKMMPHLSDGIVKSYGKTSV